MTKTSTSSKKKYFKELHQHLNQAQNLSELKLVLNSGVEISLTQEMVSVLIEASDRLSKGQTIRLAPVKELLTTNEAAEILNISRPYLIRLLDKNEIPFHWLGTHRRLHLEDVTQYKAKRDQKRFKELGNLIEFSQANIKKPDQYFQGQCDES